MSWIIGWSIQALISVVVGLLIWSSATHLACTLSTGRSILIEARVVFLVRFRVGRLQKIISFCRSIFWCCISSPPSSLYKSILSSYQLNFPACQICVQYLGLMLYRDRIYIFWGINSHTIVVFAACWLMWSHQLLDHSLISPPRIVVSFTSFVGLKK